MESLLCNKEFNSCNPLLMNGESEQKPRFENCWVQGVRWGRAAGAKIRPGSQLGTVMCQIHFVKAALCTCSSLPGVTGRILTSTLLRCDQGTALSTLFFFFPAVIPLLLVLQNQLSPRFHPRYGPFQLENPTKRRKQRTSNSFTLITVFFSRASGGY